MCVIDGLVCRKSRTGGFTLAIPTDPDIQRDLMVFHYKTYLGGHVEAYRMIGALFSRYYWPRIQAYIKAFIKECPTCLAYKVVISKPQGLLYLCLIPSQY